MTTDASLVPVPREFPAMRWLAVIAVGVAIGLSSPPQGTTPEAWRLLAIFAATIVGAAITPLPLGAMVLLGVITLIATRTLPMREALSGYADSTVWLVVSACFIARAVLVTGLGKRLAFLLIRLIGHHTIGLAYALIASGALLSTVIPSSTARSGGIVYPVAVGICDAFDSRPGPTARRLGAFLMMVLYQTDGIVTTMFMTGAASNFLKADIARVVAKVEISYALWAKLALVPALACLLVVPWVLLWLTAPSVRHTPEAPRLAIAELARLGPLSCKEVIALAVLVSVTGLWTTQGWHGLDSATVALLGVALLLACRVVSWEDILTDRGTWDIFVWYGGLLMMGTALGRLGVVDSLTTGLVDHFTRWPTWIVFGGLLATYFYGHYFFASTTAHATAMDGAFLKLLVVATMPPLVAAFALSACSNVSAGLTHYGSTTGPIFFGAGLVDQREWWRVGLLTSMLGIAIWLSTAALWWGFLGLW